MTAAPPSLICEAFPAVMLPALSNAGRRLASDSSVVSARTPSSTLTTTGSPLRWGTSTLMISVSNSPSLAARAARSWELAATWSCDWRSRPADAAYFSVPAPMAHWSKAQNRPSYIIESTTVWSPMRKPARAPGSRYGALVMDSIPPATTMSASPAWIMRSARWMALTPDRQTLLMVVAGTVMGMPPFIAAWRAVIWPAPA